MKETKRIHLMKPCEYNHNDCMDENHFKREAAAGVRYFLRTYCTYPWLEYAGCNKFDLQHDAHFNKIPEIHFRILHTNGENLYIRIKFCCNALYVEEEDKDRAIIPYKEQETFMAHAILVLDVLKDLFQNHPAKRVWKTSVFEKRLLTDEQAQRFHDFHVAKEIAKIVPHNQTPCEETTFSAIYENEWCNGNTCGISSHLIRFNEYEAYVERLKKCGYKEVEGDSK